MNKSTYNQVKSIIKDQNPVLFLENKSIDVSKQDEYLESIKRSESESEEKERIYKRYLHGNILIYNTTNGIEETNIPLFKILNIDYDQGGRMCFSNQIKLKKLQFFGDSFEDTIEKWTSNKLIHFLDDPSENIHNYLLKNHNYLEYYQKLQDGKDKLKQMLTQHFFNTLSNICEFEKNQMSMKSNYGIEILNTYNQSINNYTHNYYYNHHTLSKYDDILLIARNQLWGHRFMAYLNTYTDKNPIFIVCGAAHLSRALKDNSFLYLLMQLTESAAERYACVDREWKWISLP